MDFRNSPERYGIIAKSLHWLIFLLIAGMIAFGFILDDMPSTPQKFSLIGLHKSLGVTILTLALLRLSWRLINPRVLPVSAPKWQQITADIVHILLYILIILMPLSGWLMSSAAGFPVSFFGLFTLPDLIQPAKEWRKFFGTAHEILAFVIIATVTLHAGAALYHHFIRKDNVLRRMLSLFLLCLLPAPLLAESWEITPVESTLEFTAIQNNSPTKGRFTQFHGHLELDRQHIEKSTLSAEVDAASVTTDYEAVAETLKTADWFDSEHFPKATFKSTGFLLKEGNRYEIPGTLSLKGVEAPIILSLTLEPKGDNLLIEGQTIINRTRFGIGQGEWAATTVIADPVTLQLHLLATQK